MRTAVAELIRRSPTTCFARPTRDEEQFRLLSEFGMRSALIVPMTVRERTLGVITFVTGPSGRRFDRADLGVAEELARRCATALDNTRLYRERSYIARTLQQSLLPVELPDMPGIEAAARFRPTGEGNEVGGDFYDLFQSEGPGWTVIMGDVCGKGPDAAAVTALARYTLRAAAMQERLPSRSLALLNDALLRQRSDRRFCTVAYAYLEMVDEGARLGLASGGHPLPMLVRGDGTVERVGVSGTLLGVVPDPQIEDRAVTLSRGDLLVFFTDGVIESRESRAAARRGPAGRPAQPLCRRRRGYGGRRGGAGGAALLGRPGRRRHRRARAARGALTWPGAGLHPRWDVGCRVMTGRTERDGSQLYPRRDSTAHRPLASAVEDDLSVRLSGGQEAPARARRALARLRADLDAPTMETLRLLVTELVGNSVKHARPRA